MKNVEGLANLTSRIIQLQIIKIVNDTRIDKYISETEKRFLKQSSLMQPCYDSQSNSLKKGDFSTNSAETTGYPYAKNKTYKT